MEILIILGYAAILGLVAPYLTTKSDEYGVLVPPTIAAIAGSVLWIILTLVGFKYEEAWIWVIIMVAMPVVMIIVSQRIAAARVHAREEAKKA
jgi:ABC-type transport system involved in cytochrome bd biosynthesis fused ATPase/permease subunit